MDSVPARMTKKLVQELDRLVEEGWYTRRSEAIRDAVRDLLERRRLHRLEAAIREDIEWGLFDR